MASISGGAVCLLSIFMVLQLSSATDHIVGDDKGWTVNFNNYSEWAKNMNFFVGDNLVFNYDNKKHNVFKVNETMYQSCTAPDENQALRTGHDVINLATPGQKWYICGVSGHCRDLGMKLTLNVMANSASSLLSSASLLFAAAAVLATISA